MHTLPEDEIGPHALWWRSTVLAFQRLISNPIMMAIASYLFYHDVFALFVEILESLILILLVQLVLLVGSLIIPSNENAKWLQVQPLD